MHTLANIGKKGEIPEYMVPAFCCSQGLVGTGLPKEFAVATVFPPVAGTISPGFVVPDASTTSLVLPGDGGLKGVGPDDDVPARSHGLGGGLLPATRITDYKLPMTWKEKTASKSKVTDSPNLYKRELEIESSIENNLTPLEEN